MMKWITLFCGAGGSCQGLHQAGHKVLVGVDADVSCVIAHRTNTGTHGTTTVCAPVNEDLADTLRAELRNADAIFASPPCQARSKLGKRQGSFDVRDGWTALVAFLRRAAGQHTLPPWLVVENVVGAPMFAWGHQLVQEGFYDTFYVDRIDAHDYGCASRRQRQFLILGREYEVVLRCYGGQLLSDPASRHPGPTLREALGLSGDHPCLDRPAPCVTATEVKGHTNPHLSRGRSVPVQRASDAIFLATGQRRMTLAQGRRLLGLPADFALYGTVEQQYRQLGNVVAPVAAELVARRIQTASGV